MQKQMILVNQNKIYRKILDLFPSYQKCTEYSEVSGYQIEMFVATGR